MAVTGQAASLDADSMIVTPLGKGSVFELGSVSSSRSSSNLIDLRVRFHCANSVWQWIRSFSVHVISPGRKNPVCAMHKAPEMSASRWSFASSSERMRMRRPRVIRRRSFLFRSPWNPLIPLLMRCRPLLPNGSVLSPRSMSSDFRAVR
jgi:hypothetical protein